MKKYVLFWFTGVTLMLASNALHAQGLTPMEELGKLMYKDTAFSYNGTQSCQTCHHPSTGFADPDNAIDPENSVVSVGADRVSTGGRNAPSAAYAGYSPVLDKGADGEYYGGMFWDGRATGHTLSDPLAEQAQGPPLNPVEMAMPDKAAVVAAVAASEYADLFLQVFDMQDFGDVDTAYDNIGRAIAAYERSHSVQRFNSRFDRGRLTAVEQNGRALFAANCAVCHPDTVQGASGAVLFTTYGYANIGLPTNPLLAGNPVDYGLGGFLESDYAGSGILGDADYASHYGKFKIPTLRNVAATPPYGHNGVFSTLTQMVQHLNNNSGVIPEVGENLSLLVGDMGLSEAEIADIVAFLHTLSDTRRP
jgi:cytochrome c peroxidase